MKIFAGRRESVFIALVLAIAGFDTATGLEHWPWGSYPMYSLIYPKRLDWVRVYAAKSTGEVAVRGDKNFAPFDEARLVAALSRLRGAELTAALSDLLRLYNRNTGEDVRTLRLYAVSWTLRPGLTGDETPDTKTLLTEVSSDAR